VGGFRSLTKVLNQLLDEQPYERSCMILNLFRLLRYTQEGLTLSCYTL